ncbi:MAG: DUF190 domain-containing protein [Chloroflexi bacterium]|nr:DUF190 domain-containing protein [Chloroflexota bacterium]MDA1002393.1 DUF190 domain-containing protein [Chloroflexota bacterium]
MDEATGDGILLRIYLGESDRVGHRPLWEELLMRAREAGLGGATVMRGVAGFGQSSVIHTTKIMRLSQDLPMVVEIVDSADKIEAFRPTVEALVHKGLVTAEHVDIWVYRGRPAADG